MLSDASSVIRHFCIIHIKITIFVRWIQKCSHHIALWLILEVTSIKQNIIIKHHFWYSIIIRKCVYNVMNILLHLIKFICSRITYFDIKITKFKIIIFIIKWYNKEKFFKLYGFICSFILLIVKFDNLILSLKISVYWFILFY